LWLRETELFLKLLDMNYANADVVGHSGKLQAASKAVDAGLGTIFQTLKPRRGAWIITADHGNAENHD